MLADRAAPTTAAQWESDVTKDVNVIKMKYPSVKNIELLTVVRCPLSCGTPPPAPGRDDYLHDIRREDALFVVDKNKLPVLDASGNQLRVDKTKSVHSGRLFVGYSNKLSEQVTFDAGVEYLQGLSDTTFWKLNGDAAITSKLFDKFSLATAFSLRYDHAPLPTKETTDTTTSVSVIYSLL